MRFVILASCVFLVSATAPKTLGEMAFDEWLAAFNDNDSARLKSFGERRLGDPDVAYTLDVREETGGIDLVKVEQDDPRRFVALTREKATRALRRVSIELETDGSEKLKSIETRALPLSQQQAVLAMNAFATRLAAADRFSGVIAIAQHGTVIYEQAFGLANRETGAPAGLNTPFFIASQGKMFTGVSILQLVEAGRIGLNDPMGKYLTDYPNKETAKVTIRQLLTHTGGTGDIGILAPEDGANRAWVRSIADVIKLNGNRPPDFQPGSKMDYSNYGFILLGAIVEKVSGQSYYDYVSEHVLRPAGMKNTAWPTLKELASVAVPYAAGEGGKLVPAVDQLPWRGMSAGGGVSTPGDELRFAEALKAGKLISLPMLKEAIRQQTDWYGYGFISSGPADFPHWGHGGSAPGMSLVFAVYPPNDMTMVCMANRDGPVCDRLMLNLHFHLAPVNPGGG